MVDHNATTEDPMTTEAEPAVGVATVPTPDEPSPAREGVISGAPEEPFQGPDSPIISRLACLFPPEVPPLAIIPVDEVLRWVGKLSVMAGSPDEIYVSVTTRRVDISTSNQRLFIRWQTLVGATPQPARYDALGTVISAICEQPGLWTVTLRAHVGTPLGMTS